MDGHAARNEYHQAFSDYLAKRERRSLLILMTHLEDDAGICNVRRQIEELDLAVCVAQKRYDAARLAFVDSTLSHAIR